MNKIEFLLTKQEGLSGDDGNDYLVVEIRVDDNLLADFQWFATDLHLLTKSIEQNGYFFILTCWCGLPDCAGLKKPIYIEHKQDRIIWKITEPEPLREFEFDKKQYVFVVEKLFVQGNKLIKELAIATTRPLEITPDCNKEYFVSPTKYRIA